MSRLYVDKYAIAFEMACLCIFYDEWWTAFRVPPLIKLSVTAILFPSFPSPFIIFTISITFHHFHQCSSSFIIVNHYSSFSHIVPRWTESFHNVPRHSGMVWVVQRCSGSLLAVPCCSRSAHIFPDRYGMFRVGPDWSASFPIIQSYY